MTHFRQRPGTKSAIRELKTPIPDITTFDAIVKSLILANPLECTSYMKKRTHPPIEKVRQLYTTKFVYENGDGERVGTGQDTYDTVEGYLYGIASVITNMANLAAHGGRAKHTSDADLFSILLKCHDPNGEIYFLSLSRQRVTVASYNDDAIRRRVEKWADGVPALA